MFPLTTYIHASRIPKGLAIICAHLDDAAQHKRNPEMPDTSRTIAIARHLHRREVARKWKIAVLLSVGMPALFFGPIILSSIYWLLGLMWGMYVPWSLVFLGTCATLIPLLFWTEWRSGGSYYADAVLSTHESPADSPALFTGLADVDSLLRSAEHPRDQAIGLVELFLWGPRQILEAVRTLRGLRQIHAANRTRAVELLLMLKARDHADLTELAPTGDADAAGAIAYLLWYDWIGISKSAGRVWIESESRKVLGP
jgi:hypothetical protein